MAKFNSLALGFKEGFGQLMCLNSPSEAFKVKGQEMSSTANMLAAADVYLTAQICEEVNGLSSRITGDV